MRIWDVNTSCVRCLDQAWPPGLLLSNIVTLHLAEQGLAGNAKSQGPAPSWNRDTWLLATRTQPRAGAVRTTWGLTHTISTVLSQERAMLCPGTIHALCKWTVSDGVTRVIHSVWQSFTCKYFIFLLNIFGWLWILDVMRTLLCMRCRQQQGLGKEEKHPGNKNKILQTTN